MRAFSPVRFPALRFIAGFLYVSAMSIIGVLVLLLLLPWRSARIKFCNCLGKATGSVITYLVGGRPAIEHRERLNGSFPAIYVMNHTSTLDVFLSIWLCPVGGCGVIKREAARIPFFGQLYFLSGHPMLDRADKTNALAALTGVTQLMKRHRLGMWILPEGTRSADGSLGPFKTGFVHVALATGLPVVPVVVHGAHEIWPRRGGRLQSGPLRIEVYPPIDTSRWKLESAREHADSVRVIMASALGEPDAAVGL